MHGRTMILLRATLLALLLAGFLMNGCADKVVGPEVSVNVHVPVPAKAGAAALFRVTVTAADMDSVTAILEPTGLEVAALLTVPVGADRHFLAEALDDLGQVLYQGEVVIDVAPFGLLQVPIDMRPVVPMLYLSPHFPSVTMGEDFTLALRAANLPGLGTIEFDLDWDRYAPVSLDSVYLSAAALLAGAFLYQGESGWGIGLEVGTIVDSQGNGMLAHFQFSSNEAFGGDAFPVLFDVQLGFFNGTEVPLDDIHLDRARLQIVNPDSREVILGATGSDVGYAVTALPGGDFLVAGGMTLVEPEPYLAPFLTRVGPDGQPLWQRSYPGESVQVARGVASSPDGDIYLVGGSPDFNRSSFISRFDGAGEMLFEEELNQLFTYRIESVAALPGGGAVVCGEWYPEGADPFIAIFNSFGYQEHFAFSTYRGFNDIIAESDTSFIALGSNQEVFLQRYVYSDNLVISWTLDFTDFGTVAGYGLARGADGDLFLAGSTDSELSNGRDMWVIRTDANGVERWRHNVDLFNDQEARDIVSTPDGGCVVAGHGYVSEGNGTGVIVARLDANGESVWIRTFGGDGIDRAFGIARGAGGGYMVVGTTTSVLDPESEDILLLPLDEAGMKIGSDGP